MVLMLLLIGSETHGVSAAGHYNGDDLIYAVSFGNNIKRKNRPGRAQTNNSLTCLLHRSYTGTACLSVGERSVCSREVGGMPLYQYGCTGCTATIERRQSFSEAPLVECPDCGGTLRRLLHPVGLVFKGGGWYCTDNRPAESGDGDSRPKESAEKKADAA